MKNSEIIKKVKKIIKTGEFTVGVSNPGIFHTGYHVYLMKRFSEGTGLGSMGAVTVLEISYLTEFSAVKMKNRIKRLLNDCIYRRRN